MSTATVSNLRVGDRFCGPPGSANGGILGGLLASALYPEPAAVEVSFLAPCPLGTDLVLSVGESDATLRNGETSVARVRQTTLDLEIPVAPEDADVAAVAGGCRGLDTHPFPGCFVCGPEHAEGLQILPGPVGSIAAALWEPAAEWSDDDGRVRPELVWAALDCTSIFALLEDAELAARLEPMVLGRMTARRDHPLAVGTRTRVLGWTERHEGRKAHCGTAVIDPDGVVVARARCTWVSLAGR